MARPYRLPVVKLKRKCTVTILFLLILSTFYLYLSRTSDLSVVPKCCQVAANLTGITLNLTSLKPGQHKNSQVTFEASHKQIRIPSYSDPLRRTLLNSTNNLTNLTSKSEKEVYILKPMYDGRLGNFMFLYASVYALAVSKKMRLYVEDNNQLRKIFRLDPEVVTNRKCSYWKPVTSPCCDYDATLEQRIVPNKCQSVGDYLQSWKYFEKYSEAIHRSFRFKSDIENSAKIKLNLIIQTYKNSLKNVTKMNNFQNIMIIGIHARRGDYLDKVFVNQGRITPPVDYYIRAMEYFRKRFTNPVFLAASDSVWWLKQNLKSKDLIFIDGKKPEEDLCLLSMCNHTIMSVGSFGWWGGYLSKGITLYYNKKLNNSTLMGKLYEHYETDYTRTDWVGLE